MTESERETDSRIIRLCEKNNALILELQDARAKLTAAEAKLPELTLSLTEAGHMLEQQYGNTIADLTARLAAADQYAKDRVADFEQRLAAAEAEIAALGIAPDPGGRRVTVAEYVAQVERRAVEAEAREQQLRAALEAEHEWLEELGCDCGEDEPGTCAYCVGKAALALPAGRTVPRELALRLVEALRKFDGVLFPLDGAEWPQVAAWIGANEMRKVVIAEAAAVLGASEEKA